ncbi:hypothetical protein BET01_00595 [Lacrimispora algidixylanolytica]|uniref:Uncharacterized protein n=1 Tax=Lacrimispora algidixylanolytica TaxID=94868 RepID=A0A419TBL3_9FIRM|nr:hypothetical protein BET01_00595 [Lacrimispora algidixylanolytica]
MIITIDKLNLFQNPPRLVNGEEDLILIWDDIIRFILIDDYLVIASFEFLYIGSLENESLISVTVPKYWLLT